MALGSPVLVWKRFKLVTWILAFGPAIKAITICWKQGRLMATGNLTDMYNWFFAAVAIIASAYLFRASWLPEPD